MKKSQDPPEEEKFTGASALELPAKTLGSTAGMLPRLRATGSVKVPSVTSQKVCVWAFSVGPAFCFTALGRGFTFAV